jgi:hypothetical protein
MENENVKIIEGSHVGGYHLKARATQLFVKGQGALFEGEGLRYFAEQRVELAYDFGRGGLAG